MRNNADVFVLSSELNWLNDTHNGRRDPIQIVEHR
jgi:hypothetical protein